MKIRMPRPVLPSALAAVAALALAVADASPAAARDSYVQDGASLFKSSTVSTLNSSIAELQRSTGKEIVVVTVPSLNGKDPKSAVEDTFSQQQVNGVLFYFAKEEKKDYVVGDTASRSFFKPGAFQDVHNAMRGYLRSGDPDTAVITGVDLVEDQYRGHLSRSRSVSAPTEQRTSQGGFGMGFFWLLLILLAGFLIIRAIFRAMAGPRMMPPGYGGPGFGGPGYGGPGYGGGYGGGGGGSFFSGLLGGLGGAFIGNELFGGRRDDFGGNQNAGFNDGGSSVDNSGFQSDPGQADMGNMGGGDWGGGGGDSGGGGGDSGGGW